MKRIRKMIEIDESKCDGCGRCINGCRENALALVDGKAKLIGESLCDGLGACIGECPRGALKIVEREAEEFIPEVPEATSHSAEGGGFVCPGKLARVIGNSGKNGVSGGAAQGELRQWPIQLRLVPEKAPFWDDAELLVAADCTMAAYPEFQRELLRNRRLVIACPKLDNRNGYLEKLTAILRENRVAGVCVAYMEVPCCGGLLRLVHEAVAACGKELPIEEVKISLEGGRI